MTSNPGNPSSRITLLALALLLAACAPRPASKSGPISSDDPPPTSSVDDYLEHFIRSRYPGVRVVRDAAGLHFRIRGTIEDPLYVIDGVPLAPIPGAQLAGLNPYEIERVEVITSPARLAGYGIRGANGAILITTKRP